VDNEDEDKSIMETIFDGMPFARSLSRLRDSCARTNGHASAANQYTHSTNCHTSAANQYAHSTNCHTCPPDQHP
jgi:hypothetical protein